MVNVNHKQGLPVNPAPLSQCYEAYTSNHNPVDSAFEKIKDRKPKTESKRPLFTLAC